LASPIGRVDGSQGVSEVSSGRIFLSYRREDTRYIAGRLFDRLVGRFGADNVFMDVNSIEPGRDFRVAIKSAVGGCDVLLALIGGRWLGATDKQGRRRLDDPDDLVVLEVKTALQRQVRVIPVLVDGAAAPRRDELPEVLGDLADRNAVQLDHETFDTDLSPLMNALDQAPRNDTSLTRVPRKLPQSRRTRLILVGVVLVAVLLPIAITVLVHSTASNTVTATISVGQYPVGVALAPDGRHAYITNRGSGSVSVIDTVSDTATVTATISVGQYPVGVALAPDGRRAYITNYGSGSVSVIDTVSDTVTATISVGQYPVGVALAPDGRRAYITNRGSGSVSVIDTVSDTVIATIPVGQYPWGVALAPDGRHAYITNYHSNSVLVIDTVSDTVTATISVGQYPWGVALAPDSRHAYITNNASGSVSVIDTASNTITITATIPVGQYPVGVALAPDGSHAYITNAGSGSVSVIDTAE
jgi:YVTN family beta-propeller protein